MILAENSNFPSTYFPVVENCETFIDKFVVKLNENLKLTKIINLSIATSAVLEKL